MKRGVRMLLIVALLLTAGAVHAKQSLAGIYAPGPDFELRVSLLHDQHAPGTEGRRTGLSAGWSFPAGVAGLVLAPAVLAMCIASDVLSDDAFIPSLPLGVSAWGLVAVTMPVLYQGGKSARRHGNARGNQGLRTTSWIAYTICNALLIGVPSAAIAGSWPVHGLIASVGVTGALSLVLVSIDNLLCYRDVVAQRSAGASVIHPWAAPITRAATGARATGAITGLAISW